MSAVEELAGYAAGEQRRMDHERKMHQQPGANSEGEDDDDSDDANDGNFSGNHGIAEEHSAVLQCTNDPVAAAAVVARAAAQVGVDNAQPGRKKRLCRFPGCNKVIKSQGHCQRHGAKAKRCKVDGCDKQAQGTHDGMCKRHWRAVNFPESSQAISLAAYEAAKNREPPPPEGVSVYESILPASIAYRPTVTAPISAAAATVTSGNGKKATNATGTIAGALADAASAPQGAVMPLISYLRHGAHTGPVGWHRNAERRARGMFPVTSLSTQLEPWERQLALVEILLLSGGTPNANFKDLAHAWGREKGFHQVLASSVCERRGEVERKRRSDAGKILSQQERETFRKKFKKTKENSAEGGSMNAASPSEAAMVEFMDLQGENGDISDHHTGAADLSEAGSGNLIL